MYHTVHASLYLSVRTEDRARNVLRFNQGCEEGERTLERSSLETVSVFTAGVIHFDA